MAADDRISVSNVLAQIQMRRGDFLNFLRLQRVQLRMGLSLRLLGGTTRDA